MRSSLRSDGYGQYSAGLGSKPPRDGSGIILHIQMLRRGLMTRVDLLAQVGWLEPNLERPTLVGRAR